jgi:CRISPR associated protein Cas1
VKLASWLIAAKLDGQRRNMTRLGVRDLRSFDALRESLDRAKTVDDVRLCEAKSASLYWSAWSKAPIRFRRSDLARLPARWSRFESRASLLTGTPRAAVNPTNALVNFMASLLECEGRIGLLAAGLDPTIGAGLHSSMQRNRQAFVFDAIEPARPAVETFVLDLLDTRVFTARDFVEMGNGVCRIRAPLTHELCLHLPAMRMLIAPIVAHLAGEFRAQLLNRPSATPTRLASPPIVTPRRQPAPRPYASKAWGAPRPEPLRLVPVACARCRGSVEKRRRRHCEACMPAAKREHGLRAIERARSALREAVIAAGTSARSRRSSTSSRSARSRMPPGFPWRPAPAIAAVRAYRTHGNGMHSRSS